MNCTHCGASIPWTAKFCGACGAPVRKPAENPLRTMGGCGFLLLMIGALYVASKIFGDGSVAPTPPASASSAPIDAKTAAARAKVCNEALERLARAGLVLGRPSADEIEVDEDAWALIPARQKRLFAAAVRCSMLGGYDSTDLTKVAIVEGYHSGKDLADAGPMGVDLN